MRYFTNPGSSSMETSEEWNKKRSFLIRVFKNADGLCNESRVLYEGKYFRRSAYLSLTGFEELKKLELSVVEPFNKNIHFHSVKFQELESYVKKASFEVVSETIQLDSIKVVSSSQPLESIDDETIQRFILKFIDEFSSELSKILSPVHMRKWLMYEDQKEGLHNRLLGNIDLIEKIANVYLNKLQSRLDSIRHIIPAE